MILRTALFAMGTRFELVLEHESERDARAAAEAALSVVEECEARLSRFRSDSLVARINREGSSSWVRVDPLTFELLESCAKLQADTQGAFDVCVGAAMDRVRKGASTGERWSGGAFELDSATSSVRLTRTESALDFGAIGKGHALDLAAAALSELRIERALLHGGTSSVIALGAPAKQPEGWRVALGAEFAAAVACLSSEALSVSAVRGPRGVAEGASRRAHVLDPRSGELLRTDARAAVVCESAADADAWSTALLVLAARAADEDLHATLEALELPLGFSCHVSGLASGPFTHAPERAKLRAPRSSTTTHAR